MTSNVHFLRQTLNWNSARKGHWPIHESDFFAQVSTERALKSNSLIIFCALLCNLISSKRASWLEEELVDLQVYLELL